MLSEKDLKRFWAKVDTSGECWEWMAGKNQSGRGRFSLGDSYVSAPRVAMMTIGVDPAGKYVLHKEECHNPGCVRPAHLYLGDQARNMKDAVAAGTHNMASKTHCPYGHSFDNYGRVNKHGSRCCKLCDQRKWAEAKARGWKRKPKEK